jgi:hypothetical protein
MATWKHVKRIGFYYRNRFKRRALRSDKILIPVSYNWSGTVTPSLDTVIFTPTNRNYMNVTFSQINQDYTAAVTISGNTSVSGVTLSYVDGVSKSVISDGGNNYSVTVAWGCSGTVTPSIASGTFCPASQTYVTLNSSKTAQNYAYVACPDFDAISQWTTGFDLSHGWTVKDYVRTVGDVNGDGKADLIGFGLDGIYVAK